MELDEQLKNFKEIDLEKQKLLLDELRDKFHNFELRKVELEKENKMIEAEKKEIRKTCYGSGAQGI
jgi:hypothetical protein